MTSTLWPRARPHAERQRRPPSYAMTTDASVCAHHGEAPGGRRSSWPGFSMCPRIYDMPSTSAASLLFRPSSSWILSGLSLCGSSVSNYVNKLHELQVRTAVLVTEEMSSHGVDLNKMTFTH